MVENETLNNILSVVKNRESKNDSSCFTLSNGRFEIRLDAEKPIIISYCLCNIGGIIFGDPEQEDPDFVVYSDNEGCCLSSRKGQIDALYEVVGDSNKITYNTALYSNHTLIARMDIFFVLSGDELTIGFENCTECPGYRFISADFTRLLSAHSVLSNARMVIPTGCGRLISTAGSMTHLLRLEWFTAIN